MEEIEIFLVKEMGERGQNVSHGKGWGTKLFGLVMVENTSYIVEYGSHVKVFMRKLKGEQSYGDFATFSIVTII